MDKEQTTLDILGNGKILIYNDANVLHTSDKTDRLNIIMDGRILGWEDRNNWLSGKEIESFSFPYAVN